MEGRGALLVKGAVAFVAAPGALELHSLPDDFQDVEAGFDVVDHGHGGVSEYMGEN